MLGESHDAEGVVLELVLNVDVEGSSRGKGLVGWRLQWVDRDTLKLARPSHRRRGS